jgi:antitoxin component YwqK of YwqJK toxin-antitoxin module
MKNVLFLFLTISLFACNNGSVSPIKVISETKGGLKFEYEMDTIRKVKHGYSKLFYENGNVSIENIYVNDTLNGPQKEYFPSGKISAQFNIVLGKYHGVFKYFFEDGSIKQEGKYVDNVLVGELKSYYENGKLKEIVIMAENVEKGPFIEYFDNGNIKTKGVYHNGPYSEIDLLELYNEDGTLDKKMICDGKGTCKTIFKNETSEITNPISETVSSK